MVVLLIYRYKIFRKTPSISSKIQIPFEEVQSISQNVIAKELVILRAYQKYIHSRLLLLCNLFDYGCFEFLVLCCLRTYARTMRSDTIVCHLITQNEGRVKYLIGSENLSEILIKKYKQVDVIQSEKASSCKHSQHLHANLSR